MKRTTCWMMVWLAAAAFTAPQVCGAPWDNSGRIERAVKKYKLDQVETISGKVTRVYEKVPSFGKKNNDALGFHMIVQTDSEPVDVHLGPAWYLLSLEGQIEEGDIVQALGSVKEAHVKDGKPRPKAMRAAEIRKNGEMVLRLRDEQGRPIWSGYID